MINNVTLIGYTTKKPELKYTQSNIPFVNFTLAVNRPFKNENGESETDWIKCIVWRKQSENMAKYVDKGHLIGVVGRIQTRTYEDDNGTKYITEVVADSIQFLESKKDDNYPKTDNEIDYTHRQNEYERKTTAKSDEFYETSKLLASEEDLPF